MLHQIDLSRADLNLLTLFEAVFDEAHVGRAAERLNLSPSAVSHGLSRLRILFSDPLFLKHPKGVSPTARALELAPAIADLLARARSVLAVAEPFDPKRSQRRFVIAANDGIAGVLIPRLIAATATAAPGVRFGVRDLLPPFANAFAGLDARTYDIAIAPMDEAPARFERRQLYDEDFVIAMRAGHKLGPSPTLKQYCAARHVLVSYTGDPTGNIDTILAQRGLKRQVALAAPSFMTALTTAASTDLFAAAPERLVRLHAKRLGLTVAPSPVPFPSRVGAFAPKVAMMDAGIAWLMDLLQRIAQEPAGVEDKPRKARS